MWLRKFFVASFVAIVAAASAVPASATVIGSIEITSANPDSGLGWLQIAEVVALSGGSDVALAGTATASAFSMSYVRPNGTATSSTADRAIDGDTSGVFPSMYHSASTSSDEKLTITFNTPQDITEVSIFGRPGQFSPRDVWNVALYDSNGDLIATFLNQSANNEFNRVDIDVATVPLPAAVWLFLTALLGAGVVGRKRQRSSADMPSVMAPALPA